MHVFVFPTLQTNIFQNEREYMQSLLDEVKKLHLVDLEPNPAFIEKSIVETVKSLSAKELLANQASLVKLKNKEQAASGRSFATSERIKQQILGRLGFELTSAQEESIREIEDGQLSNIQMMKLLQGDVGVFI